MPKKPTIITNPPKTWWAGDERVEKYMSPVSDAIKRHIKWPSAEFTDIYNRAYEAVYQALNSFVSECKHESRTIGDDGWICNDCGYLCEELDIVGEDEQKPTIIQCPYCKVVYKPTLITIEQLIKLAGEQGG